MVHCGLQEPSEQGVLLAHQALQVHPPRSTAPAATPGATGRFTTPSSAAATSARRVARDRGQSPRRGSRLVRRRQVVGERPVHRQPSVSARSSVGRVAYPAVGRRYPTHLKISMLELSSSGSGDDPEEAGLSTRGEAGGEVRGDGWAGR